MPIILDPDDLNQGTEVVISTGAKTIQLVATGNLSTDGVTLQCLYSFLKDLGLWLMPLSMFRSISKNGGVVSLFNYCSMAFLCTSSHNF